MWVPGDPEGLVSLEGGNESPAGPTVKVGACFGCVATTPLTSDSDFGRGDGSGDSLREAGGTNDSGFFSLCRISIDVGGGSCGGEICGVIIAGSICAFLCSMPGLAFPSCESVPAGVRGGECMTDAGGDGLKVVPK